MDEPRLVPTKTQAPRGSSQQRRVAPALVAFILGTGLVGGGLAAAAPSAAPSADPSALPLGQVMTLRVHGYDAVASPESNVLGNRRASGGSNSATDPRTGRVPEDAPYLDPRGPFDPLSLEAPEGDFVTWDPAWISERLADPTLRAAWPGLVGVDEVSQGASIRASNVDASEKVWLRHWYEPQHLDLDLGADGRLTDANNDGVPDAPANPAATDIDEWYPAVEVELTYMLVANDRLPLAEPAPSEVQRSAPRPACGTVDQTQMVFPVGVMPAELAPDGSLVGHGLTSLDLDLDGTPDNVRVSSEATLPDLLGGARLDFDGDGALDRLDPDGVSSSCDEMVVLHSDAVSVPRGGRVQFLDDFLEVEALTDSAAVVGVWGNGDLVPVRLQRKSLGIGSVILAGQSGPVTELVPGGTNLGTVPAGAWFAYLADVDVDDESAVFVVGRALGAACGAMESSAGVPNRSRGGPWFLKRFYVDGHEYNVTAIGTCGRDSLQSITLRTPLPKSPVTLEQHSVRLQDYSLPASGLLPLLVLPPPFDHEHTILQDVAAIDGLARLTPSPDYPVPLTRPEVLYMGGPAGPVAPVLGAGDAVPYRGRYAAIPVGPYTDVGAMRWTYASERSDPLMLGELREKLGAFSETDEVDEPGQPTWFYNEQAWTLPWRYTEFLLPDQPDDASASPSWNADSYHVTTAFTAPTERWRRWSMPDQAVPAVVPPVPPDLIADVSPEGGQPLGAPRRAAFWFDPDVPADTPVKLFLDADGARLFGGQPGAASSACDPGRPELGYGAGDTRVAADLTSEGIPGAEAFPVEVFPYTDPWAPFNPQHAHAPRSDSMTANPAYMDEFLNFGEPLGALYAQLSADGLNAREKVYHRLWYEPRYTSKIRFLGECGQDLSFPALIQEFTYLYVDTTDNPTGTPAARGRFAFPIGTGAHELPMPQTGGALPPGGDFGYGLTTFDANFDGADDAVTVHSERTLAAYLDTQWQANRPDLPGYPLPTVPGPRLDFDGDGMLDDLDTDGLPLTGDEMVVFAVQDLTLDLDPATPETESAQVLDYVVTLENVTRGARAQVRLWYAGGGSEARPQRIGGIQSLDIGSAAVVDRFQSKVTLVGPGQTNTGVDGAWFVFLNDVAKDHDRVTVTVGRALGATHSAVDDGAGRHDLLPGDPWYLKRFYVDGHEYNVVAVMTLPGANGKGPLFQFITIRTPVPKGNVMNSEDTLFQQGYFVGGLPATVSVMPPFNVTHTIAVDIARLDEASFANTQRLEGCTGTLAPFGPLAESIVAESHEPRLGTELRELLDPREGGWQTDQTLVIPWEFTDVRLSPGQLYLYTSNWRSPASRLSYYGCLRRSGPPQSPYLPDLTHAMLTQLADAWSPPAPAGIVPPPNQSHPPQPVTPPGQVEPQPPAVADYFDASMGGPDVRLKLFYDPAESSVDTYVNVLPEIVVTPTATFTPTRTDTATSTETFTPEPTTVTPEPTTVTPTPTTVTPTPTDSPRPTKTPTPTATCPPEAPPFHPVCTVVQEDPLELRWTDATTWESEFQVEVSFAGSPFIPYASVSSHTPGGTGTPYLVTTGSVPYNSEYRFRVRAVNSGTGQVSGYSDPSPVCRTPSLPSQQAGCFTGQMYLQGRSDHSGAAVYYHGFPVAQTDRLGGFTVCGVPAGTHTVSSRATCYLETRLTRAVAVAGRTVTLPFSALRGGDVNNDARIDLFDLVRVGADYGSEPPIDPEADCNVDGRINLFDLVMVGSNYGMAGPTEWGDDLTRVWAGVDRKPAAPDLRQSKTAEQGSLTGRAVRLDAPRAEGDLLVVPVTAHDIAGLYGADITLAYDPGRLEPVDSMPDRSGLQLDPGSVWDSPDGYVVRNSVDAATGTARFAASRLKPAGALWGDVVIAEMAFRPLSDQTEGAAVIAGAVMSDKSGRRLDVRWSGLDVARMFRAFLPRVFAGLHAD